MEFPDKQNGIKEFLLQLLIPSLVGIFLFFHEFSTIGKLATFNDVDEWLIGIIRVGFTLFFLPFILVTDWLIYFGIVHFPLGSHGWQIRFFGKTLYALVFILVLLKALDKLL